MAIGIDDEVLKAQVEQVFACFDALEIRDDEVVLVHGDLGSHNVAFAPETSEVLGVYDFDAIACVDWHWDFKYLHSYTPPFRHAVLQAYRDCTGIPPTPSALSSTMPSLPSHTSPGMWRTPTRTTGSVVGTRLAPTDGSNRRWPGRSRN